MQSTAGQAARGTRWRVAQPALRLGGEATRALRHPLLRIVQRPFRSGITDGARLLPLRDPAAEPAGLPASD